MSTTATPATPATLEQKILLAADEASQIAEIFSPAVSGAIEAGVAAEPIISGMIQMFVALFKHHTKTAVAPVAAAPAPAAATH